MSISEIAAEYGVSRTSVHTYRRSGSFPRPAPVGGTEKTKLRFRADEVAAWFAANPKQQGKRTDLATKRQPEGAPVSTTIDPRIAILSALNEPPYNEVAETRCVPWDEAVKMLNAYRRAVLLEAADKLDQSETLRDLTDDHMHDVNAAANELRRMADEGEASDG
jgi:predicted DNA-binding transcriptional regulator AlpA